MATFHISFKKLRRSEGKSSVYLSAYQNREKTKDNRTGATWDYSGPLGKRKLSYVKRFKLTGDFVPLSANP